MQPPETGYLMTSGGAGAAFLGHIGPGAAAAGQWGQDAAIVAHLVLVGLGQFLGRDEEDGA